jgi:hypothetical protein
MVVSPVAPREGAAFDDATNAVARDRHAAAIFSQSRTDAAGY